MRFQFIAVAAMASIAAAKETVTYYACATPSSSAHGVASSTLGFASYTRGVASSTLGSTGVVTASSATGSPITHATGAASINGVPALGLFVAGGVALLW